LRELLTRPLTAPRTTRLTAGILRGLEHAHRAGLIHRDLKPENVIVEYRADGSEVPRIVDFGIAVLRDPDGDAHSSKLTADGIVVGTPQYMAPEQAMGEAIDHRVDLFALGVAVYEMLAGVAPFTGSAQKVVLANVGQDPPPIEERAPRVGADPLLELFARKLMARSLATRFESAHEALRTLELVERDPEAAALALGKTDVSRASALIALPSLPDEDE
jgi:serine/threonine-protein kinase